VIVYSSITLPITVAKLETFCINAAHQGHAQAQIKIDGDTIQVVLDNEPHKQGENHEQQI